MNSYLDFDRRAWAALRASTPLTLAERDLDELRGINERVSLAEVEAIYLPLLECRLDERTQEFKECFEFQLDPSYELTHSSAEAEKNAIVAILQRYNRVNLLIPIGAPHMWHAAVESKTVKLTALGEHYRRLAAKGLI